MLSCSLEPVCPPSWRSMLSCSLEPVCPPSWRSMLSCSLEPVCPPSWRSMLCCSLDPLCPPSWRSMLCYSLLVWSMSVNSPSAALQPPPHRHSEHFTFKAENLFQKPLRSPVHIC
uniref:Uncharacterized protein n=1 Tax=Oncorhynchus kisutch TaxID=8019 RepID=A0A8C7F786_ONCKI